MGRPADPPEPRVCVERLEAQAADGATLALHRVASRSHELPPVILAHGTFSNAQTCMRLACRLAARGHACYILELRGHGASGHGAATADFEAFSMLDVPAALGAVHRATGGRPPFWVGHSGGGLVLLMYLARTPEAQARVRGIVMLGSQATDAAAGVASRLWVAAGLALNNLLGRTPGRRLGLGPEDEPRRVMNQWFAWNWWRRWVARDGFDFLAALAGIDVPTLAVAGSRDAIAPPAGCRRLVDALGSRDKQLVVCGREHGFERDYSHAGLIASAAAREVWPRIDLWLAARSREP